MEKDKFITCIFLSHLANFYWNYTPVHTIGNGNYKLHALIGGKTILSAYLILL